MRYLKPILFTLLMFLSITGAGTKEIKLTEGIQPGNFAPEINWQNINLKTKKLVLLQFWAGYDAQSRMLNVQMYNVISHLKTDGIRLVSISMDENEAVFEGIVKAEHLNPATQFNDPRGNKSELFKAYHLKSGFNNWLVNADGIIIAKNVKPKDIPDYVYHAVSYDIF